MNSTEAYHELLEEILNNLEEAMEEDNWDGIGDVIYQIREALDNPFDNYIGNLPMLKWDLTTLSLLFRMTNQLTPTRLKLLSCLTLGQKIS